MYFEHFYQSLPTMLGIKYIKTPPTIYVIQYAKNRAQRKGAGLSFFYYAPTTTLVTIPTASQEAHFMVEQVTGDFQQVTVQGRVSYRVKDPERLAAMMDFTLKNDGRGYATDDHQKLPARIVNVAEVIVQREIKTRDLRGALALHDKLAEIVAPQLTANQEVESLGIEILGVAITAIKPLPETARALEAQAREQILKEADDAIYGRRNAAVEQERKVKENELNTAIAVENKQREIAETKMEAKRALQAREHQMETIQREFDIVQEQKRKELVTLAAINAEKEAEARAHGIKATMAAFAAADPKLVQALVLAGMQPEQMIANAFQGLAENAGKIGELTITPDLLQQIMKRK
jgi:regulator of protease activity HflC (stomatin/prohibitin superfamily)